MEAEGSTLIGVIAKKQVKHIRLRDLVFAVMNCKVYDLAKRL
jgi:hypothetical protein